MSLLKYIYNLFSKDISKNIAMPYTKTCLSEEAVRHISKTYAANIGWTPESLIQNQPLVKHEKAKIIWEVFFKPKTEDNLPLKGGHLILYIDDETGDVIKKVIGTR